MSVSVHASSKKELLRIANYVKNINDFNKLHPQEKVYLHFDNNIYFLGDTLWFKSYLINTEQDKLSELSKVLYVELLTQDGRLVESKKLKVENGQCHGEFALKHSYLSGFYEVRAYTRYMLNWGNDHIYSRVFPVYMEPAKMGDFSNIKIMEEPFRDSEKKRPNQQSLKEVNLNFYPEGGNMLVGQKSRVAFKMTDNKGQAIDAEGIVYNSKGEKIVGFSTLHDGMGDFTLIPDAEIYQARIKSKNKEYKFNLPKARSDGYSMFVDNLNNDSLRLEINSNRDLNNKHLGLSIMSKGHIFFFYVLDLNENNKLSIPKSAFKTGVQNITLFNNLGEVLASRLVFVDKYDTQNVFHTNIKNNYAPFEHVQMGFLASDKSGLPIETNLSLSVRDASTSFLNVHEDNIKTNLLLSSDLKGYIHNPGYYFSTNDEKCRKSLDLLMMVQGWRRYEWKQMAGVEPFTVDHQVEEGLLVKGKVLSWFRKNEKENMDVLCWLMKDGASLQGTAKTDENGDFAFFVDSVDIYDRWQLGLQGTEKGKRKDNHIILDRFFSPSLRPYLAVETEVNDSLIILPEDTAAVNSLERMQLLPEFVVKQRISRKRPNLTYNVEREVNEAIDKREYMPPRVKDYLEMKHSGFSANPSRSVVLVKDSRGRWASDEFVKGMARAQNANTDMDGAGSNKATNIDIMEVKSILVIQNTKDFSEFLDAEAVLFEVLPELKNLADTDLLNPYESESNNISLDLRLKHQDIRSVFLVHRYPDNLGEYKKGVRHTYFDGYSQVVDFYNPDYSLNPVIPGDADYRRTLYWNPNLKTDKDGKASVSFYNNSIGKQIVISCEGISPTGGPLTVSE